MSVVQVGRETNPDGFYAANGTVGTTPAQASIGTPVLKHVVVRANTGNSNTIKVAGSSAGTATGFILAAGETSPPIYVDDVNKVWLVGGAASQGYSWIAN